MKINNAIKRFIKAGFSVSQPIRHRGRFVVKQDGFRPIWFFRNGTSDELVGYYLGDGSPPYPKTVPQAIEWATK